ncbi:hypothetical protein HPULCUR_009951 [Helicostylum pulchrum]|uniref:Uncharacterized protein n=1 Tax=Helicostylum pulchrum TaxID=562976 RepID=A0ABP9YCY6_9FUNG
MSSSDRSLPDGHNRLLRNLGITNKDVESVYVPKGYGWCGYNTVAYMILKNKRMSDVAGRFTMGTTISRFETNVVSPSPPD